MITSSKTKIYKLGGQVLYIPLIGRRETWNMRESPNTPRINLSWWLHINSKGFKVMGL